MHPPWSLSRSGLLRLLSGLTLVVTVAASVPTPSAGQATTTVLPNGELPQTRAQQLFVRGLTQAFLGNHEEALGLYDRALQVQPDEPGILAAKASAHEAQEELPTALYYAEQARSFAPENPDYYHLTAQLHARSGDLRAAAAAYETLLDRFPENSEALRRLAHVYVLRGQDAEALATYERLIERAAQDAGLRRKVLPLYERTGNIEGAIRTVQALVDLEPGDADLWHTLGTLYVQQSRLDDAAQAYGQALTLDRTPQTVDALADVYRAQGRSAAADRLQAVEPDLNAASVEALLTRASAVLDQSTDRAAARSDAEPMLREILARDPDHPEALGLLGDVLYAAGAYPEAADLLQRALAENPRSRERWHRAADAYLQADAPAQAMAVAEEGTLLFPGQPDLLELLGDAHAEQGDVAQARDYWQQALDVAPDRTTVRQKLERQQN